MTLQEYDSLKQGDVVQNEITLANYVIVNHYSTEQITQVAKHTLLKSYLHYKIISRAITHAKNSEEHGDTSSK